MQDESQEIVIVSAARTPVGKFMGALSGFSATELGAIVVREAIARAAIDSSSVDECLMGCVLPAGLGQNPARQAALRGGCADSVAAMTLNMVCGSGLKAVALAAQSVATGNAEVVVAGGMESMSNAPYLLPAARKGFRMGDSTAVDSMIRDGLWCACEDFHMGMTAELVADKFSITRAEQDAYALESHRRAAEATRAGRFAVEIASVTLPGRKGSAPTVVSHDESIRYDAADKPAAALDALAALRPAFKPDGTVTAGNAPGVNDAAAAVVVMSAARARSLGLAPMVTIRAQASSGVAPKWVMMAPVTGVQKVLARAGWSSDSVDLFELNEAFSVQALAITRELGLTSDRVNVNGGSVAIGHPIGASGARILVTLIHEMIRRDVHRGVAALCLGGGNSVALAIER
ncbi:MAG: acetyl-CoA C-acyltransferase [Acidobacteriota bacterium]|nr:acetyl-CoA C-acyltransferase [Acidobacteriota bacterium]